MAIRETCISTNAGIEGAITSVPTLSEIFTGYPIDPELLTEDKVTALLADLQNPVTDRMVINPARTGADEIDEQYGEALFEELLQQRGVMGVARVALCRAEQPTGLVGLKDLMELPITSPRAKKLCEILLEESAALSVPSDCIRLAQPPARIGQLTRVDFMHAYGNDALLAANNAIIGRLEPLLSEANTLPASRCLR